MKNYIVIYHAPQDAMNESADMSPEEMKKGIEPWMVWAKKCGDKLVDMGSPLGGGLRLKPDGKSSTSSKEVSGYSILQAKDMDEVKSLLVGHPHLQWNADCEIEVHESMPMPEM